MVCKAFTQLGADPDLDLGAASQEKSPRENSQLLVCVRSIRALLRLLSLFSPMNVSVVSPREGAEFSLHVAEEIFVHSCSVLVLPRTLMIFGIWLKTSVQLWGNRAYCVGELSLPAKYRFVVIIRNVEPLGLFLGGTCSSISAGLPINSYVNTNPKRSALRGSMCLVEYCKPFSGRRNYFSYFIFFSIMLMLLCNRLMSVFTPQ